MKINPNFDVAKHEKEKDNREVDKYEGYLLKYVGLDKSDMIFM